MGLDHHRFEFDDSDPEPDLSPMIDCVFILLIFFIVTATFVEEDGFQVNRPESSSAVSASESETVLLLINGNNRVVYEGKEIGLESVRGVVRGRLQLNQESPVVIQSSPKSRHGLAMEVHDECLAGGTAPARITHTID